MAADDLSPLAGADRVLTAADAAGSGAILAAMLKAVFADLGGVDLTPFPDIPIEDAGDIFGFAEDDATKDPA